MNNEQKQTSKADGFSKPDFIGGFIGCVVVNGLFIAGFSAWLNNLMKNNMQATGMELVILCLLPLVNLVGLSFLFWVKRSVAIGATVAFILAVIILLVASILFSTIG